MSRRWTAKMWADCIYALDPNEWQYKIPGIIADLEKAEKRIKELLAVTRTLRSWVRMK